LFVDAIESNRSPITETAATDIAILAPVERIIQLKNRYIIAPVFSEISIQRRDLNDGFAASSLRRTRAFVEEEINVLAAIGIGGSHVRRKATGTRENPGSRNESSCTIAWRIFIKDNDLSDVVGAIRTGLTEDFLLLKKALSLGNNGRCVRLDFARALFFFPAGKDY
jgi:hypothetical protein